MLTKIKCLLLIIVYLRFVWPKGIIIGLDNLEEVINAIRKASSNAMASADLRKSKLPMQFSLFAEIEFVD